MMTFASTGQQTAPKFLCHDRDQKLHLANGALPHNRIMSERIEKTNSEDRFDYDVRFSLIEWPQWADSAHKS